MTDGRPEDGVDSAWRVGRNEVLIRVGCGHEKLRQTLPAVPVLHLDVRVWRFGTRQDELLNSRALFLGRKVGTQVLYSSRRRGSSGSSRT